MGNRWKGAIERYLSIQEKNLLGGGKEQIERQHSLGKLTARERIDELIDKGTFSELGSCVNTTGVRIDGRFRDAPCDGAIVGTAKVHGRSIMIYATDFTVLGGSMAQQHIMKYCVVMEMAASWGIPLINLLDSSGGRLSYIDVPMAGVEWMFYLQSVFSGVMPQITVLMGPCIAGGAYVPALCDFLFMSRVSGNLWLGGPRQTAAATGEKIDRSVGGADYHMQLSGTCDWVGADDKETIAACREFLRYLPSNYRERPPLWPSSDKPDRETANLIDLVPEDFETKYDMHDVVKEIVDDGDFFEIKSDYARQILTGYCRFNGEVVGLVANNPAHPGSLYEVDACDKYAHFLQALDAYNTPLVTLVDTPPALAGEPEEAKGLLRHIGKVIDVYATSTIPKIGVVLRESYADCGSLVLSGARGLGADLTYAWPIARFAVEASEADYRQIYGKGIEEDAYEAYLNRSRKKLDVFDVAGAWTSQVVDEIIEPKDTRKKIIEALDLSRNKTQKLPSRAKGHGSSPT